MIAVPKRMPPYQPLGDLLLRFSGQENATDYVRELDIGTGIVRVSYQSQNARFTREVFASAVDQVIVIRLISDRPGRLSFTTTLTRGQDSKTRVVSPDRGRIQSYFFPPG
ncbi:MAG: glycoside hydrolase N-terminal domain-containing protein [Pyrinomonadaceae bacterium]